VLAKEWVGGELERSTKSWRERKCTERGTVTVGAPECRCATGPLPELLVSELTTLAPVHCRSFATTEHLSGVASFSEGFRATIVEWGEDNISTLTGSP
jgi:hypothetical protein